MVFQVTAPLCWDSVNRGSRSHGNTSQFAGRASSGQRTDFYREICFRFNVHSVAIALHNNGSLYYFTRLSTGN